MTANGDKRLDRLFAAARGTAPDTSGVEEGFEARVAARVREARGGEEEALFGAWAWRLAPLFAAVALTVGVWTAATGPVQGFGTGAEVAAAWEAAELADSLGGGS
jgi:hypothetical protein